MIYALKQDLIDRFGQQELIELTDRTNVPPTTIDDTVIDQALEDATALADSYLGKVYTLPLSATPDVLTKKVADVARYYLHGKSAEKDGAVARGHAEAMAWLKDVAKGLVALDAEGVTPAQSGGGSVRAKANDRLFTRDSLKDA